MVDLAQYGPWAVIAGGSEGVGRAFAAELADAGVNLVLIARKPEALAGAAADMEQRGVAVRTLSIDLTKGDAPARIATLTADLDVGLLIYNAGANTYGSDFVTGDLARFDQVIRLNITTPLAVVHHYGAAMKEAGRGGILLVGSLSGYLGGKTLSVYSGVKAFSRSFAESLWLELQPYGVDVLELILGVTRTPAMQRAGLDFAVPGLPVSVPEEVAREGLSRLKDGPTWIVAGNADRAKLMSGANRAELLLAQQRAMEQLLARTPRQDLA